MISDFAWTGGPQLASLMLTVPLGTGFILTARRKPEDRQRRTVRLVLAATLILVREARYVMDLVTGV